MHCAGIESIIHLKHNIAFHVTIFCYNFNIWKGFQSRPCNAVQTCKLGPHQVMSVTRERKLGL